ncbi:MAG: GTPase HflX, partial [Leptospiraceae bacterium]|nr:GTPase HflX [Leptospiraceae bacterium]
MSINQVFGNLTGLKSNQIRKLQNLSNRRIRENMLISMDVARLLSEISLDIGRQVGLLIQRSGYITHVIVGDRKSIEIPPLDRTRSLQNRLRGLRLVHTHLNEEPLSEEDLTDLVLLRLDYITAVVPDSNGIPKYFYSAHINPDSNADKSWVILERKYPGQFQSNFLEEIQDLENAIEKNRNSLKEATKSNRAFLIGVYLSNVNKSRSIESSLNELKELCRTAGVFVVDSFY